MSTRYEDFPQLRGKIRPKGRSQYGGIVWEFAVVDQDGRRYVSDQWRASLPEVHRLVVEDLFVLRRTLNLGNRIEHWSWTGVWA